MNRPHSRSQPLPEGHHYHRDGWEEVTIDDLDPNLERLQPHLPHLRSFHRHAATAPPPLSESSETSSDTVRPHPNSKSQRPENRKSGNLLILMPQAEVASSQLEAGGLTGTAVPARIHPEGRNDDQTAPSGRHHHATIFNEAHSGGSEQQKRHVASFDEQEPIKMSHLFKGPVIRQWLHEGRLYREKEEREPSRFELFFDLLFVGVVHQLADGLSEVVEATSLSIVKFLLVFYPAFSIWGDVRTYINQSGTDDVLQRIYILFVMFVLVGYTANATGIEILQAGDGIIEGSGSEAADNGSLSWLRSTESITGIRESDPLTDFRRRQANTELVGGDTSNSRPYLVQPIGTTGFWFVEGYHKAIMAAVAFFLVAKIFKLLLLFTYGMLLPRFRKALWLEMIPVSCLAAVYIPLAFVYEPGWIVSLIAAGIGLDVVSRYLISILIQTIHSRTKRLGSDVYIPAQSVEHLAERTVLFVILVVGESILNSTFKAESEDYGISFQYARSALSVTSSFFLIWIYFDCDSSRVFMHALRRNPFSAITFNLMHFPLCAGLILLSSTLPRLIREPHSQQGFRWFYGTSIAVVMFCIASVGVLHKNLDLAGSALWPQSARIALRLIVSVIFALVPLQGDLSNMRFLAVYTGLLGVLVLSETFGKLGVVGRRFDEQKADEYYRILKERSRSRKRRSCWCGWPCSRGDDGANDSSVDLRDLGQSDYTGERQTPFSDSPEEYRPGASTGPSKSSSHPLTHHGNLSSTAANLLSTTSHFLNPYTSGVKLSRKSSWHPYGYLFGDERGDEDVGIEDELGQIEVKDRFMDAGQRWAVVAN